jgi:hypothetical protein
LKTIIYLDQNYLFNLTRARLGTNPARTDSLLWEHLLACVQNEVAVCPFSPFRRTESELLGRADERDRYDTASQIYCGVEFREFEEVLRAQARSSLKRFLGAETNPYDPSDAFSTDPHGPCSSAGRLEPPAASFASWTRWVKEYHERHGMPEPSGDFSAHKLVEARAVVESLYLNPAVALSRGSSDIFTFSALDFSLDLFRAHDELMGVEDDGSPDMSRIGEFLRSDHMAQVPFIDIHSSLVAGIVVHSQERNVQGSDLEDVLAISTVLPYADILTTDRYMKDLVCRLHLDDQYEAKVFSASEPDVDALCSLVGQLAQSSPAGPPPKPPQ